jgi:hypothetical protein
MKRASVCRHYKFNIGYTRGEQIFRIKVLGTRMVTQRKLHTEKPQILSAPIQNSVVWHFCNTKLYSVVTVRRLPPEIQRHGWVYRLRVSYLKGLGFKSQHRGRMYWLKFCCGCRESFDASQTFSHINTPTFSNPVILHTYPPMKMEQTVCSETSAYTFQTPGTYPEESIKHTKHGESLKTVESIART